MDEKLGYYQKMVDELLSNPPVFPEKKFKGKGIVICGGGQYFSCVWVCVNILRFHGCNLPIELWYLGTNELNSEMEELINPFGVACIDAFEVAKLHPIENLIGWELKPYAILHSSFEEVLYLDADNVPVRNPEFLFSSSQYLETGALFWPDRYRGFGKGEPWLRREAWMVCRVPFHDEPEFEAGQLLVDKKRCWYPLVLTLHLNEHSEFYYTYFYGDKDTFHLAWRKLGHSYTLIPHPNKSFENDLAIIQYDFEGQPLFQHRNGDKWSIQRKNLFLKDFQFETECFTYLEALRSQWNGLPENVFSDEEKAAFRELVSTKTYLCTTEGQGTWWLELLWDFRVIEPHMMNKIWSVKNNGPNGVVLNLKLNTIYGHTCRLWPKANGIWRGRWMTKERQEITLVPKLHDVKIAEIHTYQALQKAFVSTMPDYPETKFNGRGIVMVGGGEKYFPCVWVCIKVLRNLLNCQLPIELWHLGPEEISDELKELLRPLNVKCVDAYEVRKEHPARILNGWELKPYAILHSQYKEIIFIDADNVPLRDPAFLFDTDAFRDTGAIFWPDYGSLGAFQHVWNIFGVPYQDEPEFETGQMVLNKENVWEALQLTMHYNEHSDFYYQYINGDKETFHMAWRKLECPYSMTAHALTPLEDTMCQYDFDGNIIFQHRNNDKWRLDGRNKRIKGFLFEVECFQFLNELRMIWNF